MRKTWLRLYAPLLVLLVSQALLVTLAPSVAKKSTTDVSATGTAAGDTAGSTDAAGNPIADTGTATTVIGGANVGTGNTPGAVTGTPGAAAAKPGAAGPAGPAAAPAASKYAAGAIGNDIAHCSKAGSKAGADRNFDIYFYAPPCQPKWPAGADNGGATYAGVTKDTIKIVRYVPRPNGAVDGILKTFGLYTDPAQAEDYQENVMQPFINKRYELWGRKVDFVTFTGNCEYSPPDVPCLVKEAQQVVDTYHPFAVLAISGLPSATYDVFARNKVISLGGWHFDESFFQKRAPYRYDILMDGSRAARNLADYYCKKLVGRPADHTGTIIHPTIGNRGQVTRKIGIMVPEDPALAPTGELLQKLINGGQCGKAGDAPVLIKYASDITRAQDQANTSVQRMIQEKVTTIICDCDPIAPLYLTNAATTQRYYPEHLMMGISLIDYDLVGRIYNNDQWQHAFGISDLFANRPLNESYEQVEWAAEGKSGTVPANMGLIGGYERVFGWFLQQAGPNLNPDSVKVAMVDKKFTRGGWEETGHEKASFLAHFEPNDWTAWDDAREVYWDANAPSVLDGKNGAYVNVDGGHRYDVFKWPASNGVPYIPVKAQ
jgi:hypothetical protein